MNLTPRYPRKIALVGALALAALGSAAHAVETPTITAVTPSSSGSSINLAYTFGPDAETFDVYRQPVDGGANVVIGVGTRTGSFTDSDPLDGGARYAIAACSATRVCSPLSVSAITGASTGGGGGSVGSECAIAAGPLVVTGVEIAPNPDFPGEAILEWDLVPNAAGYNFYRDGEYIGTLRVFALSQGGMEPIPAATVDDDGASYQIVAFTDTQFGPLSCPASTGDGGTDPGDPDPAEVIAALREEVRVLNLDVTRLTQELADCNAADPASTDEDTLRAENARLREDAATLDLVNDGLAIALTETEAERDACLADADGDEGTADPVLPPAPPTTGGDDVLPPSPVG